MALAESYLYRYRWPKNPSAAYYIGSYRQASQNKSFKTTENIVHSNEELHIISVQAYTANGQPIGDILVVKKTLEKERSEPVTSQKKTPYPPEILDFRGNGQPPSLEEKPPEIFNRPFAIFAQGSLGKESLTAEGGYSKFAGSPVIGGFGAGAIWQRPQNPKHSLFSYHMAFGFHQFSFDMEETLKEDTNQNRTIKEKFNRLSLNLQARYALFPGVTNGDDFEIGLGLAFNQVPYLEITDQSRGESRLKIRNALSPSLGFYKGLAVIEGFALNIGIEAAFLQLLRSGDKLTAFQLLATGDIAIDSDLYLEPGLKFKSDQLSTKLTCPDVVNVTDTCKSPSSAKTNVTLGMLGLKKIF